MISDQRLAISDESSTLSGLGFVPCYFPPVAPGVTFVEPLRGWRVFYVIQVSQNYLKLPPKLPHHFEGIHDSLSYCMFDKWLII